MMSFNLNSKAIIQPKISTPIHSDVSLNLDESSIKAYSEDSFETTCDSDILSSNHQSLENEKKGGDIESQKASSTSFETDSYFEDIGPWEEWLLRKELSRRNKIARENAKKKITDVKDSFAIEANVKAWLQQKIQEMKIKERNEKEKLRRKNEQEKLKKVELKKQSEGNFINWKKEKLAKEIDKQTKLDDEKKENYLKEQERKSISEEAYKDWLKTKAPFKTPCKKTSYVYLDGSLISYHDLTSPPTPSFINPVPWESNMVGIVRKKEMEIEEIESIFPPSVWPCVKPQLKKYNLGISKS